MRSAKQERAHLLRARLAVAHERHRHARLFTRQVARALWPGADGLDEPMHRPIQCRACSSRARRRSSPAARAASGAPSSRSWRGAGCRVVIHHASSDADAAALRTRSPRRRGRRRSSRPTCASRAAAARARRRRRRRRRPRSTSSSTAPPATRARRWPRIDDDAWAAMFALNVAAPHAPDARGGARRRRSRRQPRRRRRLAAVGQLVGLRRPRRRRCCTCRAAWRSSWRRARASTASRPAPSSSPTTGTPSAAPRQLAKIPLARAGSPGRRRRAPSRFSVRRGVSDRRLHPRRRRRRPAIDIERTWGGGDGTVEELSFSELVQELAHFEHESGPPDLEKSIRRRSIDARLMRLLSSATSPRRRAARVGARAGRPAGDAAHGRHDARRHHRRSRRRRPARASRRRRRRRRHRRRRARLARSAARARHGDVQWKKARERGPRRRPALRHAGRAAPPPPAPPDPRDPAAHAAAEPTPKPAVALSRGRRPTTRATPRPAAPRGDSSGGRSASATAVPAVASAFCAAADAA